MQGLRLPSHVYYGKTADRRLFLDLMEDRYFLLQPEDEILFEQLEQGGFAQASHCNRLVEAGILTFAPEGRPIQPTMCQAPGSSLIEAPDEEASLSLSLVGEVLIDLLAARYSVRRNGLADLSGAAFKEDRPAIQGSGCAVRQFIAARRLVPLDYNCLRDSLALRRFLRRRKIASQVVIGAKLHPFAAHCWVQADDVVLNDSLAAAECFSPILVL